MFFLLLLLFLNLSVSGFNLEPRIPVIKSGGKASLPERYFGFSVAQHVDSGGKSLLLVGSPQDDNLQPGTSGSGALWACSLSMKTQDCVQVPTDGKRHSNLSNTRTYGIYDGSIDDLQAPINSEIKDGQWLGGMVQSQGPGGKVIVCAHRYTVRDIHPRKKTIIDSKRGMLGMCYILDSDLQLPRNKMIGYKNVVIVRESVGGRRLEGKGNFDDHANWGVCQLGTSAGFVQDESLSSVTPNESMALFGAPGCFTWRGNLFASQVESMKPYEQALKYENLNDYDKHGHLGLSVASGKFDGEHLYFASGAPSAGETGSVFFFRKDSAASFEKDPETILHGEVFGEGFGHVLVSLDVNGDSSADLLVGAPFFEEGCVYLYPSRSEKPFLGAHKIKILGEDPLSQFGLAISSLGDLNRDGFQDFAVGAPYESNVGGSVYIFLGGVLGLRSRNDVSSTKPLILKASAVAGQIITGKEMSMHLHSGSPRIHTFGGSLSGGLDMDRNGYPDLLVGAYSSNHVFLLRSRPIIDIKTSVEGKALSGVDPGASGCLEDPDSNESCFSFQTCFQVLQDVDRSLIQSHGRLHLKFAIEAEPEKPVPRISLRLAHSEVKEARNRLIEDSIFIQGDQVHCTKIVGYVGSLLADIQTPVPFAMSYSIIQEEPLYDSSGPLPNINDYPILNQAEAKRTFQASFDKDCGEDDVCKSAIEISPSLRDKSGLELSKAAPNQEGFYTMELGSLRSNVLILDVLLHNKGEAAYESTFHVFFPHEAVSYIGLSEDSELNAPLLKNASWLLFNTGNPFKNNENATRVKLRFQLQSSIREKVIQFYLNANTSSAQVVDPSTYVNLVIVTRAEVKIVGGGSPSRVYYGGKRPLDIKGESAIHSAAEIGPQVMHKYQIINGGPSPVSVITVQVDWPIQVENGRAQGKWLLYMTEPPVLKNGKGVCVLPPEISPNPLNYSLLEIGPGRRRIKRELERIITPSYYDPLKGHRIFTFDCDRGTAKCVNITCQIYNLGNQESVTILIKSRLWNVTLEEDYNLDFDPSEEVEVEIFSKANIILDGDVSQNIADDYFSIRTVANRIAFVTVENNLPWWIILIAVLSGLLLLVFISLALWKLGFFKRKRIPEEDEDDFLISATFEKNSL